MKHLFARLGTNSHLMVAIIGICLTLYVALAVQSRMKKAGFLPDRNG